MRVSDIINRKGGNVVTLSPDASISQLVQFLADHRIGAVVITDEHGLAGIVSERDIVRYLKDSGAMGTPVSSIMTTAVTTCHPDDDVRELATIMTDKRIRHLPVLDDGSLVAIISIGDVVKARLDDLEAERDHLERFVHG